MGNRGRHTFWVFVLLAALTWVVFFVNIAIRDTSLSSPQALCEKLSVPIDNPAAWWNTSTAMQVYFNSRFLFQAIVRWIWSGLLHSASTETFYQVFVALVFLCISLTAFSYYSLLESGFRVPHLYALAGAMFFLFSFPVLLGFDKTAIVYMKGEDLLAYLLVVLCLFAILRGKLALFALLSILGAITRENTLLVIPAFFLYSQEKPLKKLLWCVPAPAAALILRLILGWHLFDPSTMGNLNLATPLMILGRIYGHAPAYARENFLRPLETVGDLFVTFGVLWFIATRAWFLCVETSSICEDHSSQRFLRRTTPLTVLLVLVTTLGAGWVRENRVIFILFPWIITLAVLELWRNDLLVRARLSILQIRRPAILVSTCLSIGVALLLLIGITRFPSALTGLLDWLKKLEHELPQSWQDLFVPMSPFQVLYFFVQVGLSIAWAAWLIGKRVRKGRAGPVVDHKLT